MGRFRTIACFLVVIGFAVSNASVASIAQPLQYSKNQSLTMKEILKKLPRHYRGQSINNELSSRFLDNYLKTLDPLKLYFFAKDVEEFKKHELKYDDYFKSGNLAPGFELYHIYRQRVISRLESVLDILEDENVQFDFTKDESVVLDREKAKWPETKKESEEVWFKRIKFLLLELKLAGKTVKEARETLVKRHRTRLNRVKQQDSADVFEILVNSLTLLYDPHTNYWSPRTSENFNINMSLSLEGIGAVLQAEDEHTKVVRLVPGGPAAKQGQLQATDRIVSVGQGDEGELVDIVGWRLDEVVQLIRGPKNTVVKLEVISDTDSASPKIIRINRGKVKLEDQAAQKAVINMTDENENIYKVGVIHLPAFYIDFDAFNNRDPNYKSSTSDVKKLISQLMKENIDGLILDLRGNGGGSLYEATKLTDLFIDQGLVVQIRSSNSHINRHNRSHHRAMYRGPLVVLVNRMSASASEIFAGAIQDYKRGLIIGSQSFGKGTVQSVQPLLEGALKITESKFYRVSGDSTQHRGVLPDIALPFAIDVKEVGESTYDNALPWDKIQAAPHAKYYDFSKVIPTLTELHNKRIKQDPDLLYIQDQIDLIEKNKDRKVMSLNEKTRISERKQLEEDRMNILNKKRLAKNMKAFKNVEEFKNFEEAEEKKLEKKALETAGNEIDVDGDTILNETGNILVDLIRLTERSTLKQAANF